MPKKSLLSKLLEEKGMITRKVELGYNAHKDNSVIQGMKLFYKAAQVRLEEKKNQASKIIYVAQKEKYTFLLAHLCIFTYKVLPLVVTKEGSKRYELQSPFCHLLALGGRAYSTEKSGHSVCNINICCSLRNRVIILEGIMFPIQTSAPIQNTSPSWVFYVHTFQMVVL